MHLPKLPKFPRFPNVFLHIRTEPGGHQQLMETLFYEARRQRAPHSPYDLLIIGPGGMPKGYREHRPTNMWSKILARYHQKVSAYPLENYEPVELAYLFGQYFNPRITVLDVYKPCVDCVPDQFQFTYDEPVKKTVTVPVRKVLADISEKLPDDLGMFDGVFSVNSLDRLSGFKMANMTTPYRQSRAVLNVHTHLKSTVGLWAASYGKTSPQWNVVLGTAGYIERGVNLPLDLQLWLKSTEAHDPVQYFQPPRDVGVQVQTETGFKKEVFPSQIYF